MSQKEAAYIHHKQQLTSQGIHPNIRTTPIHHIKSHYSKKEIQLIEMAELCKQLPTVITAKQSAHKSQYDIPNGRF